MHDRPTFPLTSDLPLLFPVQLVTTGNFDTNPPTARLAGGSDLGDFRPSASYAGAGNRAGPHLSPPPRSTASLLTILLLLIAAAVVAVISIGGCTEAQRNGAADNLSSLSNGLGTTSTTLVGSATTRPSGAVTFVEAAVPASQPYIEVAGTAIGFAGLAAGWIANALRTKPTINTLTTQGAALASSLVDHKAAIAEVVSDVKSFAQPTVPWTHTTAKIIADVAGMTAAAPVSATTITDLTLHPAPSPSAAG